MTEPAGEPATRADIRVVLFGFGLAGRVFHAPLITCVPELGLDGIVTGNAERAAQAMAMVPAARIIASSEQALQQAGDFDLAIIAGANITHLPLALACLDAGLHVVIDKPVAPDAAAAETIARRAAQVGRLAIPFQNRRWDSDFLTLRRLVAEQPIGEVHRFESRIERMRPALKGNWRESSVPEEMGGVLLDFGAHLVDQAIELMGPVEAVSAVARSTRFAGASDDDTQFLLHHEHGTISVLVASQAAAFTVPRFTAFGTAGGVRIEASDTQEDALKSGRTPAQGPWGSEPAGSVAEVRVLQDGAMRDAATMALDAGRWDTFYPAVASAILGGTPPPVPFEDAVQNMRVLDAARASAASGATTRLDPPAAHQPGAHVTWSEVVGDGRAHA